MHIYVDIYDKQMFENCLLIPNLAWLIMQKTKYQILSKAKSVLR